ncbi:MAG: metallophosphoesterase [Pyrinomonadaceae bacterium]
MTEEKKRHKMVGWYDPFQLARTGYEVFVSTMFGKHADKRIIQAILDAGSGNERLYHEIKEQEGKDFWFDYVSDVGDGFNSTYTVAYHLTEPDLNLVTGEKDAQTHPTKRGELLIFGGDEVYPTAGPEAYDERLVFPYNTAFPKKTRAQLQKDPELKSPPVFAIPGNHDWYDSLAVFTNLFCRARAFCGWKSYQNRSYFAVKLPRGWWIFGTDMQLSSSLDDPQQAYFKTVVENHFEAEDKVILCNAEPWWITKKMYPDDPYYKNHGMGFFEGHLLRDRIAIHVAGDRHYYRRHEEISKKPEDGGSESKTQKIVAGGGGAFLHPTHFEGVDEIGIRDRYELKASYPNESTTFWLTFRNLGFLPLNLKFGIVTGLLYLLTAQAFKADLSQFGISEYWPAIKAVLYDAVYEPTATFWVALIILAFYFFTDTHSKYLRYFAGPLHAVAHFIAVFAFGWIAAYWLAGFSALPHFLLTVLIMYTGGHVIGSIIFGLYLLVSLNIFRIHHNEAFSAIKIEGFKNFLRFQIQKNGDLTIYPVGIEAAIRDWKEGDKASGKRKVEPKASVLEKKYKPFLIEEPIKFVKPVVDSQSPEKAETVSAAEPAEVPDEAVVAKRVTI